MAGDGMILQTPLGPFEVLHMPGGDRRLSFYTHFQKPFDIHGQRCRVNGIAEMTAQGIALDTVLSYDGLPFTLQEVNGIPELTAARAEARAAIKIALDDFLYSDAGQTFLQVRPLYEKMTELDALRIVAKTERNAAELLHNAARTRYLAAAIDYERTRDAYRAACAALGEDDYSPTDTLIH